WPAHNRSASTPPPAHRPAAPRSPGRTDPPPAQVDPPARPPQRSATATCVPAPPPSPRASGSSPAGVPLPSSPIPTPHFFPDLQSHLPSVKSVKSVDSLLCLRDKELIPVR